MDCMRPDSASSAPFPSFGHLFQFGFNGSTCRFKAWPCCLDAWLEEWPPRHIARTVVLVEAIFSAHRTIRRLCIIGSLHFWQCLRPAAIGAFVVCPDIHTIQHEAGIDLAVGADEALNMPLTIKGCLAYNLREYLWQGFSDIPKVVKRFSHIHLKLRQS